MKNAMAILGLLSCLTVGLVIAQQGDADARQGDAALVTSASSQGSTASVFTPAPETFSKKCSFNSDCSHGKCSKGQCGGCGFDSDCKGWGKCSKGQCGSCSFGSDCKGFGSCSGGRCTKSPY